MPRGPLDLLVSDRGVSSEYEVMMMIILMTSFSVFFFV